jgi:hypothetical protein
LARYLSLVNSATTDISHYQHTSLLNEWRSIATSGA